MDSESVNESYCVCVSNTLANIVPMSLKESTLNSSFKTNAKLAGIMIANGPKLSDCEKYSDRPKAPDDVLITEVAKKVLSENKNNVLTPQNREDINPTLELGYQFAMVPYDVESPAMYFRRLTKINGDDFYFSTVNKDETIDQLNKYLYVFGKEYYLSRAGEYKASNRDECQFIIGECEYMS